MSSTPGGIVPAGIALGLSILIGLARWLGSFLNATTESFVSWPFATLPVVVEVGLAVAGFTVALASLSAPARRSHGAYLFLAGATAVLGFAINDGLYQLITLAL